jgi:glutamate transport system permease protein
VSVVLDNLDVYLRGLLVTVELTLLSYAIAFAIGAVVAAFRVSPVPPLRALGTVYVGLVRNTPLAVLFILFFFGFPKLGLTYSPFLSALVVLSVYTGAFMTETIRAGINTVAGGQADAARAVGLTSVQTMGLVVLPQALRSVVPPLGNLFIALAKNTSIASLISVAELVHRSDQLVTDTAQPLAVLAGVAVAYLILTLPSGLLFGALERRVAVRR